MFLGLTTAILVGYQLRSLGAEQSVPSFVAISFSRELGALLSGIVVAARNGASFTAELGTMNVSGTANQYGDVEVRVALGQRAGFEDFLVVGAKRQAARHRKLCHDLLALKLQELAGAIGHPLQQRNRSQHRHNEPHRIPWAVPADRAAKEAADDGPHNAEKDRDEEASRVSSGHEELGNDTDDEAKHDPTYDSHDVLLL
jgi:hypothetical protein